VRLIRDCNSLTILDLGEVLQALPYPISFLFGPASQQPRKTLLVGLCLCESVGGKNGRTVTCGRIVSCVGLSARDVMLDFSIRPTGPGFIVFHVFLAGDGDGKISMKQGWAGEIFTILCR